MVVGLSEKTSLKPFIAEVFSNRSVSASQSLLSLRVEGVIPVQPGQFMQLQIAREDASVFLRRPFSVFATRRNRLEFLYKVVGRGTAIMGGWKPGRKVSLLGPFGNRFSIPDWESPRALVVAGGTGLAGVSLLLEELAIRNYEVTFLYGLRNRDELPRVLLDRLPVKVQPVYENRTGYVTEFLEKIDLKKYACCYTCGPVPMMAAVTQRVQSEIPIVQISMETVMGCGFGVCYTCPVPKTDKEGYFRACIDGPVFNAREIALAGEG